MPEPAPTDWTAIGTAVAAVVGGLAALGAALRGAADAVKLARKALGIDALARDVRALTTRLEAAEAALQELAHADPRPAADRVAAELRAVRSALARITPPDADG